MSEKILVKVDPDLEDLIPGFLNNRRGDVDKLGALLASADFPGIRLIGHSMKGAGGGYGFDAITDFGAAIEEGALAEDDAAIRTAVDGLADYLSRVEAIPDEDA
ncbi:MAG: Hpt domain-containing protein [Gammaproteobacteria bacterium]